MYAIATDSFYGYFMSFSLDKAQLNEPGELGLSRRFLLRKYCPTVCMTQALPLRSTKNKKKLDLDSLGFMLTAEFVRTMCHKSSTFPLK
jgi:hypothetical protein